MSISAPDYQENPGVEQARLNFNRSALNATAWLRRRTGTSPLDGGRAAPLPAWLGGNGTGAGSGGSLPATVNNALAASGMPSGRQPSQVSQEAIDAARAQFESVQGSNSFFSKAGRVMKTTANLALQTLDMPVEVVRNTLLSMARDTQAFTDHPSVAGFFNATLPDPEEAIPDTTVNAFINVVQKHGLAYALGPDGIGTGYTLDEASAAWKEKEDLAAQFYTLKNGDPATIGRFLAASIGADKDGTFYKTFSGIIDATTLLLDPTNLIIPEVKATKAVKAAEALADLNKAGSIKTAVEAVQHYPGAVGSAAARDAHDVDKMAMADVAKHAEQDPELFSILQQAQASGLGSYTEKQMREAAFAADLNEAGLTHADLIDAYKRVAMDADSVHQGLVDAEDYLVSVTGDIYRLDRSIEVLSRRADESRTAGDEAAAAADEAERAGLEADKAQLEKHRAAQELANAQYTATRRELLQSVEARQALQVEHDAVLAQHEGLSEAARQSLSDAHRTGRELQAAVFQTMSDLPEKDLAHVRTRLQAAYGVADGLGANMRTALYGLADGKVSQPLLEVAARVDDFALMSEIFRGMDADTVHLLTRLSDPEDIKIALIGEAVKGDIGRFTNRAKLYLANRGERIGAAGTAMGNIERRFQVAVRSTVPRPDHVNLGSRNDSVKLVKDQIDSIASLAWRTDNGGAQAWWDFRNKYVNLVANAPDDFVSRKNVIIQMQDELVEIVTRGVDEDTRKEILSTLGRLREDQRDAADRAVTARAEMAQGKGSDAFGYIHDPTEQMEETARLIRSSVDLSAEVSILDPKVMRQWLRRVDDAKGLKAAGQWTAAHATALNDLFDESLRSLYLVFRPGYVALQVVDGSGRSLAMGATNGLANPLNTVALGSSLMTGNRSRFFSLMDKLTVSAPIGADGKPMFGSAQRQFHDMGLEMEEQSEASRYLQDAYFRDISRGRSAPVLKQGWKAVARGEKGYHAAWAEDALRFHLPKGTPSHDPMYQAVLALRADGVLPRNVEEWALERWGGTPVAMPEDVITEYFFRGPGQEHLFQLASAARTREGVPNWVRWIASDREKLKRFLFDPDDPISVHSRAAAHTAGFDQSVVALFRDLARGQAQYSAYLRRLTPNKINRVRDSAFHRDVRVGDDVESVDFSTPVYSWAAGKLRAMGVDGPLEAEVRSVVDLPKPKEGMKEAFNRGMDGFFGFASQKVDKPFGQVPFLFDMEMRQTARRVSLLTPEDARVVYERMMGQMPKHRSPKLRETARIFKAAVDSAAGDGSYTIDEITRYSKRAAFDDLKEVMYGAKGRSESAQRMSLLWPFLQSSVNGYRVFTKAVAQNPHRAVNAMRAWENAKTEDSGVIYDVLPGVDRDDPTQPLIQTDAYGQQHVSVPFLGYVRSAVDSVLGLLPFYEASPFTSPHMDVNVSKWNPVNYGEPLPGVGMGITVPASAVRAALGEAALPSWLEEYIYPYQGSDVSQDQGFLYANAPWFVKALAPSPQQEVLSTGTAMSALMATDPDRYADPATGYVTQEGASLLTREAADLAKSLNAMGQVWGATFRGGQAVPKTITDVNGKAVALSVIFDAYQKEKERTTSGQAMSMILDKYGTAGIAYLIGKRESVAHATDQGYEFARANQDVLDAAPDMLGYFFPASEVKYRSPEYDRLLSELDRGHAKTPEEYAQDINRTLWQARVGRLDDLVARGQITASQYKTEKAHLSEEYNVGVQGEFNTKRYEKNHLELRSALENQELAANPVGMSLARFYEVYDQVKPTLDGATFSGKKDARQREAMIATGEALAEANPAFRPLWDSELKWEFRED